MQERTEVAPKAARKRNYFVRHWRGELSLPVSYWLNGLIVVILTVALTVAFSEAIEAAGSSGE